MTLIYEFYQSVYPWFFSHRYDDSLNLPKAVENWKIFNLFKLHSNATNSFGFSVWSFATSHRAAALSSDDVVRKRGETKRICTFNDDGPFCWFVLIFFHLIDCFILHRDFNLSRTLRAHTPLDTISITNRWWLLVFEFWIFYENFSFMCLSMPTWMI